MQSRLVARTGMTSIKEVLFPEVGRHGMLIIAAEIGDKDEPRRIMDAIWDSESWRWIIVVDDDCNVRDWDEVMWRVVSNVQPERDVMLGREFPRQQRARGDVDFDPPSRGMGIDATFRFKPEESRRSTRSVATSWRRSPPSGTATDSRSRQPAFEAPRRGGNSC